LSGAAQRSGINRRDFVRTVGASTSAALSARAAGAPPRQVVLMITDSVRADMLNCYRHTGLKTPNLDRIAAGGVRFDRAYTCQPVCTPARSALFTGTYPHSNGAWANSLPLGQTVHTIGQRLHDRGIHTAYVGKWHLDGSDYFGTGRPAPGWDPAYWYDMRDYLYELTPEERVRSRKVSTNRDPNLKADFTFGHRCSNRGVDFISKHGNQDFLLVISYDEPHDPFLCPKPYSEMYRDFTFPASPNLRDSLANKPEEQQVWAGDRRRAVPGEIKAPDFFGCLTFIDHEMGRVLDAVEKYAPGAMIIYTSDHGDFLESHHLTSKGPAMYDEITRVPFLMKWPGKAPANSVCKHPVSHIDVSGTLMEFFGQSVPKTIEGRSMLATFRNPGLKARDQVFMEWGRYEVDHDGFGGFQPIRCVMDGRYKLSIHLLTGDELYDLENDPAEMTNLIHSPKHVTKRNELHDHLLNWMDETRDPFRGYYWGRREWRRDFPVSWANSGMTRQRESDGYEPRQLVYETGLPMEQATRSKANR
jgi:uncharacterized sulfatase